MHSRAQLNDGVLTSFVIMTRRRFNEDIFFLINTEKYYSEIYVKLRSVFMIYTKVAFHEKRERDVLLLVLVNLLFLGMIDIDT